MRVSWSSKFTSVKYSSSSSNWRISPTFVTFTSTSSLVTSFFLPSSSQNQLSSIAVAVLVEVTQYSFSKFDYIIGNSCWEFIKN